MSHVSVFYCSNCKQLMFAVEEDLIIQAHRDHYLDENGDEDYGDVYEDDVSGKGYHCIYCSKKLKATVNIPLEMYKQIYKACNGTMFDVDLPENYNTLTPKELKHYLLEALL